MPLGMGDFVWALEGWGRVGEYFRRDVNIIFDSSSSETTSSWERGASPTGAPEGRGRLALLPPAAALFTESRSALSGDNTAVQRGAGDQPKVTKLEGPRPGVEQSPVSKPLPGLFPLI